MEGTLILGVRLKDWAWIIGGALTVGGFIKGLIEFSKTNKIKRAEFLEKLILEFNDPKMFIAKRILDDFWIETHGDPEMTDSKLLESGSLKKKEPAELKQLVKKLLRSHSDESVTGYGEHRARQSFDDMLDFFTKLEYYLSLKLISKQELSYFKYYFERCAYKADGAVLDYAENYGYHSLPVLLNVLQIVPKKKINK